MDISDQAYTKFDDDSYLYEWAKLYNEFYIYKNNELNMVFAKALMALKNFQEDDMEDKVDALDLFHENYLQYEDAQYDRSKTYGDWWGDDCKSAYLTDGTKPVDWMKKRILKCKKVGKKETTFLGEDFFQKIEDERLKDEAEKIPSGKMVKAGIITDTAGYVYVIRDMDTGLYKIGETNNWRRRFKQLKVDDVKIVAIQLKWVSNRHEIENYHHDLYSAYRLPQSEWFKLSKSPNL